MKILLVLLIILLTACGGGDNTSSFTSTPTPSQTQVAIIATIQPDYSGGAHAFIEADSPYSTQTQLLPTASSDITVACYDEHFYRLEKYGYDNVSKLSTQDPSTVIWQYSATDSNDTVSPNLYDIVFVDETKAYLIRYGSERAWIVNPSASQSSDFKTGELDLSFYADADGVPEMADGVVVDDKLFIIIQRYENFTDLLTAYVVVFDTNTDTELTSIALPLQNPLSIQYLPDNDLIYIQGAGKYSFGGAAAEYTGGIATLDPNTYNVDLLIDDGDDTNHPFGNINAMALVSDTKGYFIGYHDYLNTALYAFNPSTGAVLTDSAGDYQVIAGLQTLDLRALAVDDNDNLWVSIGDTAAPAIYIIDSFSDNIIENGITTDLQPQTIVFCNRIN